MNYNLRPKEELLRSLFRLKEKQKQVEDEFQARLKDIASDMKIINLELQLWQSIGKK